ncbi:PulJ/GspJ family protein [Oleiharenicola lentus]|uniref:PulJ/GspJ family protein n=1 Tax=Oleiharenicola lentus TaxID=2508720 RepID=UPI003F669ABF
MISRKHIARSSPAAFTITEVMVSMTIVVLTLGMSMSLLTSMTRTMYKDSQRLVTNGRLRYIIAQISQKTIDASEFYIFPSYKSLDGTVDLDNDVTTTTTLNSGVEIYHGDCLVLVTRVTLDVTSAIRQFRIYYRVVANTNSDGPLRYYESRDYGATSTQASLSALLNTINLNSSPSISGSVQLSDRVKGRPSNSTRTAFHPIFSSEYPTISQTNENVSLNFEIIKGTTANNLLSTSSFNYTISPRR